MVDKKEKQEITDVEIRNSQHEDAAMKTLALFFAEELFPLFHIPGKVKRIAPTEIIHLELKKLYQDFNFEMEDDSWIHFEFQSTNEGVKGLKRFRTYEAFASYQHEVAVTTYVLFSGKIKNPITEYTEGINTYRICPIILQNTNADELLNNLESKMKNNVVLSKDEMVSLAMCSLMNGECSQKERFHRSFAILQTIQESSTFDKSKIEAVIYAMAEKFLSEIDLEEIKEDLKMWKIGKILMNEGKEEGERQTTQKIVWNMKDDFSVEQIAMATNLTMSEVSEILNDTSKSVQ